MANETELERIVVRLVGDGSSFQKMMSTAASSAEKTTKQVMSSLNKLEQFAGTLLGTFGSLGIAASLRGAFDQFAKLERGQLRLNSIIQTNGGDVAVLTARYKEVAEAISSVTLNTKGEVLGLFQMAEAQQFSGDAAENVVRVSVALAGATGQAAESMVRVAAMMQRGHPEMAKRALGLRGVADGAELVTTIERRMAGGMALAQAEFNSASGKMERLGRSMKSVGVEVGGLIAGALLPLVSMVQQATEQFKLLDPAIKKVVYQVTGLTLAWLGMGPVTSVLKGLLAPIINLAYWLGVTLPLTILNTVAWAAWKVVMLAFKIVMVGVNTVIFIFNTTLSLLYLSLTAAVSGFTLLIGIVGGTWFVALVGGFTLIKSLLTSVTQLGGSIYNGFNLLTSLSGPFQHIGELFGEWKDILVQVYETAKTDLPAAWNLLTAGFNLAVEEIKDLWPPLWNYVKEGFGIVMKFLRDQLSQIVGGIAQRVRIAFLAGLPGSNQASRERETRDLERSENAILNSQASIAANALSALGFQAPQDSLGTSTARDNLGIAQGAINALGNRAAPAALKAGQVIGGAINKGIKGELQKFDAALYGSNEALARIAEYVNNFRNPTVHGAHGGHGAVPGIPAPNGGGTMDEMEDMMGGGMANLGGSSFPGVSNASFSLGGSPGVGSGTVPSLLNRIAVACERMAGKSGGGVSMMGLALANLQEG